MPAPSASNYPQTDTDHEALPESPNAFGRLHVTVRQPSALIVVIAAALLVAVPCP